jgi:hypothetical protein
MMPLLAASLGVALGGLAIGHEQKEFLAPYHLNKYGFTIGQ